MPQSDPHRLRETELGPLAALASRLPGLRKTSERGVVAIGGAAVGYYAAGGAAYGRYVLDAMQRSPEAVELFSQWGIFDGFGPLSRVRRCPET